MEKVNNPTLPTNISMIIISLPMVSKEADRLKFVLLIDNPTVEIAETTSKRILKNGNGSRSLRIKDTSATNVKDKEKTTNALLITSCGMVRLKTIGSSSPRI